MIRNFVLTTIILMLTGCTTVSVQVTNKDTTCTATYTALWNDLDAAQYNVCGGSADLLNRKSAAPSLIDVLKAYQTLSAAGVKP